MIWLLILAIAGFVLSYYIYYKKNKHQELVCVIGEDCDKVVNSKYGTTFGIDNTIAGMLYYAFVALGAILILSGVNILAGFFVLDVLIIAGLFASLFSIYLIGVQLFILKEWCEYCLGTSVITILIFLVEVLI